MQYTLSEHEHTPRWARQMKRWENVRVSISLHDSRCELEQIWSSNKKSRADARLIYKSINPNRQRTRLRIKHFELTRLRMRHCSSVVLADGDGAGGGSGSGAGEAASTSSATTTEPLRWRLRLPASWRQFVPFATQRLDNRAAELPRRLADSRFWATASHLMWPWMCRKLAD